MAIYQHDCEACIYLGSEKVHGEPADIYMCPQEKPYPTMIARYGDEGHQYTSMSVDILRRLPQEGMTEYLKVLQEYYIKRKRPGA